MAQRKRTPQATTKDTDPDRVAYAIRLPRKHFDVIRKHAAKAGHPIAEEIRLALNGVYSFAHVEIKRGGVKKTAA